MLITLQGGWIQRFMSILKSLRSILNTSRLNCFQLVGISSDQSAPFEKKEAEELVSNGDYSEDAEM